MKKKILGIVIAICVIILVIFAFSFMKSGKQEVSSENKNITQEKDENKTENKKEEISSEEKKYQEAVKAEELKYYTYAKNKYKEILSYKDSQKKYDDLIEKLKIYNGTYKGESNTYKNVKVDMVIEDGEITLNFEGQTKSDFEMYGCLNDDGVEEMVFSQPLRYLMIGNTVNKYDSDKYALFIMNGEDIVVSSRIGNSYKTWNGYYTK